MSSLVRSCAVVVLIATSVASFSEDYKNTEKQIRKIMGMATDKTGRRLVSMSMADTFKLPRPALVEERRRSGMDYGSLFVAHQLTADGASMEDLIAQWKASHDIWQIGNEHHANWKKIAADAHKMNTKIEDAIYRHFLNDKNTKADDARDLADHYDPMTDGVKADFAVSMDEIAEAQNRYVFWRDHAADAQGKTGRLSLAEEKAAYAEPSHRVGSGDSVVMEAPAAGGIAPGR
jgi:hypothetical protein